MLQKSFIKNNLVITGLNLLYILFNFVAQLLTATFFGASIERDAFFGVSSIPFYINSIFLGSALVVFFPLFVRHDGEDQRKGRQFTSDFLVLSSVLIMAITLAMLVFGRQLLHITLPGFSDAEIEIALNILWVLLPYAFFQNITNTLTYVFHAKNNFMVPALTVIIPTLTGILFVIVFKDVLGINSLALGTTIGWALAAVVMLIVVRPHFSIMLRTFRITPEIAECFKVAMPLVISGVLFRANYIIERLLASDLTPGSISYLGYSNQLINVITSITVNSIAATVFPVLSRSWVEGDQKTFFDNYLVGIKIVFLLAAPVIILVASFSGTIVALIFEHGVFSSNDTIVVAQVTTILLGSFLFLSLNNITSKVFYITKATTVGFINSAIELTVYVSVSILLLQTYGVYGLAIASVASVACNFIFANIFLGVKYSFNRENSSFLEFIKIVLAASLMLLAIILMKRVFPQTIFVEVGICIVSSAVYLLLLWLFKVREFEMLQDLYRKK